MTPTYEEMLKGSTTWRGEHMGVSYILSHHGHRTGNEYPCAAYNPGTWCYYIIIPEQMYPHRWADFAVTQGEYDGNQGPSWDHDWFDSEITWASSEPYWDRKTKRQWDAAKVGCDYAHLWHRERGYPDTYASVTSDVKRTIERFLEVNSDRCLRCDYSGIWDDDDRFYEAINGRRVHVWPSGLGEGNMWYWGNDYSRDTHPGIYELLTHSDCDGEIDPNMCAKVADELEALLPALVALDDGGGHISRDGGYGAVARRFIAGCREAHEAGETLEFG